MLVHPGLVFANLVGQMNSISTISMTIRRQVRVLLIRIHSLQLAVHSTHLQGEVDSNKHWQLSQLRMQYSFYFDIRVVGVYIRILFTIRLLQVTCTGLQTQTQDLALCSKCNVNVNVHRKGMETINWTCAAPTNSMAAALQAHGTHNQLTSVMQRMAV